MRFFADCMGGMSGVEKRTVARDPGGPVASREIREEDLWNRVREHAVRKILRSIC